MDWSKGYTSSYYACLVDINTWADTERFEILSGGIKRMSTGLRDSADLDCTGYDFGSDKWVRIWMRAEQVGDTAVEPLFTGIVSDPERTIDGSIVETPLQCYSVLKPAQDMLLPLGWYAAKGFSGADVVRDLLSVSPAPITVEDGSPRLSEYIIAESNESRLTMADKILDAIGWRLQVDGYGRIHIGPLADKESAIFGAETNDQIEPKVTIKYDWFDCPNVFRASSGDASVTVYDDDPDSPLSTVNRGREVWAEEASVKLSDTESLRSYAVRKLTELQATATTISYDRSFDPAVLPTDKIRLHYPANDLSGIFTVESQDITLDGSATTSEEVKL